MPDSLEDYQFKFVAEGPNGTAVLTAVSGRSVPGSPVLFSCQRQFLPDLVDPGNRSCVGDGWVTVAGVDSDLVLV